MYLDFLDKRNGPTRRFFVIKVSDQPSQIPCLHIAQQFLLRKRGLPF